MIDPELLAASDFMMVRAELVRAIGANEALIASRIHWRTSENYAKDAHMWTDGKLWWNASIEVLEEETGISARTLRRALEKLVSDGHVLREKHQLSGRYDQSYSYRLELQEPRNLPSGQYGHIDVANLAASDVANMATSSFKTEDRSKKRATRIPNPFMLTKEMREWAVEKGITVDLTIETEKFVDYWRSAPDSKGMKLDWIAAWRLWIRNAQERRAGGNGSSGAPRPTVPPAPTYPSVQIDPHDDWEPPFREPLP